MGKNSYSAYHLLPSDTIWDLTEPLRRDDSNLSTLRCRRTYRDWLAPRGAFAHRPSPISASTPLILGKSRMRKRARTDLCGGRSAMVVPTATAIRSARKLGRPAHPIYRQVHSL